MHAGLPNDLEFWQETSKNVVIHFLPFSIPLLLSIGIQAPNLSLIHA